MSKKHRVTAILLVVTLVVAPTLAQEPAPVVACGESTVGAVFCVGAGLIALADLVFGDKDKIRDKSDEIILREGLDCKEQATGSLPIKSQWNPFTVHFKRESAHFDNDEAKSLHVGGMRPGTQIFLADSPDGKLDDDWILITLKNKEPFCLLSLNGPGKGTTVVESDFARVEYYYKNGLNGKVSFARVTHSGPSNPGPPQEMPKDNDRWDRKH